MIELCFRVDFLRYNSMGGLVLYVLYVANLSTGLLNVFLVSAEREKKKI